MSSAATSIPVVQHLRHLSRPPMSSPLTFYVITIILHLHRASISILPGLCCGTNRIIFHCSVYFAEVVCLPSPIWYSPRSVSLCTTLLAPLWSTLLFSLSVLIFSLRFYFLFWRGSSLSVWCSRSALICRVFPPLAFTPLCSNLIIPLSSVWSDLLALSLIFSTLISPLMLRMFAPVRLDQIAHICSVFWSSGPSNFSYNNLPLCYTSSSPSMYYNIEFINNLDINFIFIVVSRTQYPTHNDTSILMLNSNRGSYFFPGCAEQA